MIRFILLCIILSIWTVGHMLWGFQKGHNGLKTDFEKFTVSYGVVLKIIAVISLVFFGGICILCYGASLGVVDVITADKTTFYMWIPFAALGIYFFCGTVVWRIEVDYDTIAYKNYVGIVRKYQAKDITHIVENEKRIYVYGGKKRLFVIDKNLDGIGDICFLRWAEKREIEIREEKHIPVL